MSFAVYKDSGKVDEKKTDRLKRQMDKAIEKIAATVSKELVDFQGMVEKFGANNESFRRSAAHRAMLSLHKHGMDVYLSAEFGDLFGSLDITDPISINSWVDIERIQKARDRWEEKNKKKSAV